MKAFKIDKTNFLLLDEKVRYMCECKYTSVDRMVGLINTCVERYEIKKGDRRNFINIYFKHHVFPTCFNFKRVSKVKLLEIGCGLYLQ